MKAGSPQEHLKIPSVSMGGHLLKGRPHAKTPLPEKKFSLRKKDLRHFTRKGKKGTRIGANIPRRGKKPKTVKKNDVFREGKQHAAITRPVIR